MGQQDQVQGGSDFGWIIFLIFLVGGIIYLFRKKGGKKRLVQKGGAMGTGNCVGIVVVVGLACYIIGAAVGI